MDTEAIAEEIVAIRNRLDEIGNQVEGSICTDVDDERNRLEERLRYLQDRLSAHGTDEIVYGDDQGEPDSVQYVPPA